MSCPRTQHSASAEAQASLHLYSQVNSSLTGDIVLCSLALLMTHEISNNVVCATSKGSEQPAHTRSLIRAFASRLNIL